MSGTAPFLLTAAAGYWVLERASDQKKDLKTVGQLVGTVIIVVSFMAVACKTYWVAKYGKGGCPSFSKTVCPMSPAYPSPAKKFQRK